MKMFSLCVILVMMVGCTESIVSDNEINDFTRLTPIGIDTTLPPPIPDTTNFKPSDKVNPNLGSNWNWD